MKITKSLVDQAFKYHPPATPQRVADQQMVNEATQHYATVLLSMVEDEDYRRELFFQIQKIRILANQAISMRDFFTTTNIDNDTE